MQKNPEWGTTVCIWVSREEKDACRKMADAEGITVSAALRRWSLKTVLKKAREIDG